MLSKNFKKYLNMHGLTIKKKIPSEETKKENITNIPSIDVNNENQEKIENTKNYDLNSYIEERKQESYVEENNTEKLDINEEENINEVIKDDKIETKESKENDEFKEELERKENIVDDKEEKETKNEEHKDIYEELENTDEELIDEIESNKSELIKPEETSKFTYDKRLKEYKIVKDNIEIITKEEITFDISNYAQALLENYKINSNKIVDYIYNDEEFKSTYKNIKKASISNLLNNPTIKIYNKTLSEISYYNNELDETKIITISIGGVYDKIFYLRIEE